MTQLHDLKTQRQTESEHNFQQHDKTTNVMFFQPRNHNDTVLLTVPNFKTKTFPGWWRGLTEDGRFLISKAIHDGKAQSAMRVEILSVKDRVKQTFDIPGDVKYLHRHQQWIVTAELPDSKGHQQVVIEDPESTNIRQVISDWPYYGVSPS